MRCDACGREGRPRNGVSPSQSQCQAGNTDEVAILGHQNEEVPCTDSKGKFRAIKRKYFYTQQVARARNLLL